MRGRSLFRRGAGASLAASIVMFACACSDEPTEITGTSTFNVVITAVNGSSALPTKDAPLPANRGDTEDVWDFTIQARDAFGSPTGFNGMVRLSVEPGAVNAVVGKGAEGRNILLVDGKASGAVKVTAVYGPARLEAEDIGYVPAAPGNKPACSDGKDNDHDVYIDFPADPGCAFANDESEEAGSFSAGVSKPVHYALPSVRDIQGDGATTPYPFEGMQLNTGGTHNVVVTRVSSDGFYVTDLSEQDKGYNSVFAFNFSTPPKMRVCDKVVYLAGTVNEFFGFTELSFPSFRLEYAVNADPEDKNCYAVPEPTVLDTKTITSPDAMEKLESALVRVMGFKVSSKFGSKPVVNNIFKVDQSNCDLNGDGQVDFESEAESSCADNCSADPECTEWTGYSARGNYKIASPNGVMIQIQTGTIPLFDPTAHKGEVIDAVTGTLRNFSGGSLNWTIETRCPDDLACSTSSACAPAAVSSKTACFRPRSIDDNDQGTN